MNSPMRPLQLAYVLTLAAVSGLGSAYAMLGERIPFQRVLAGPWEASPRARTRLTRMPMPGPS